MSTLGKLMVIWGVLLPLVTLPSTAYGIHGVIPLLNVSLRDMDAYLWPLPGPLPYERIVTAALLLVGFGLSFQVISRYPRMGTNARE